MPASSLCLFHLLLHSAPCPGGTDLYELYPWAPFSLASRRDLPMGSIRSSFKGQERSDLGVYFLWPFCISYVSPHLGGGGRWGLGGLSSWLLSRFQESLLPLVHGGQGVVMAPHCHAAQGTALSFIKLSKPLSIHL